MQAMLATVGVTIAPGRYVAVLFGGKEANDVQGRKHTVNGGEKAEEEWAKNEVERWNVAKQPEEI